jgi:hypothetical protein
MNLKIIKTIFGKEINQLLNRNFQHFFVGNT